MKNNKPLQNAITTEPNTLYVLKGLAIIYVAIAHMGGYKNPIINQISSILGTMGVPIFLFLSGYFFNNNCGFAKFWRKKLFRIVIPWLLWGTITFTISSLSHRGENIFLEYIKWITGNGTWLYFVLVLLFCFILFFYVYKNKNAVLTIITIGIVNIIATSMGLVNIPFITNLQNPLNWVCFFGMGILIRNHIRIKWNDVYGYVALALIIICSVVYIKTDITADYWSPLSIIIEFSAVAFSYLLATKIKKIHLIEQFGIYSYPIYFLHIQVGGILYKVTSIVEDTYPIMKVDIIGFKPFMVVIITYCLIRIGEKILCFFKIEKIKHIFGL